MIFFLQMLGLWGDFFATHPPSSKPNSEYALVYCCLLFLLTNWGSSVEGWEAGPGGAGLAGELEGDLWHIVLVSGCRL